MPRRSAASKQPPRNTIGWPIALVNLHLRARLERSAQFGDRERRGVGRGRSSEKTLMAQLVVLAPVAVGAAYSIIAAVLAILWMRLPRTPPPPNLPPVTVLKPLYGAAKNLRENLPRLCV